MVSEQAKMLNPTDSVKFALIRKLSLRLLMHDKADARLISSLGPPCWPDYLWESLGEYGCTTDSLSAIHGRRLHYTGTYARMRPVGLLGSKLSLHQRLLPSIAV